MAKLIVGHRGTGKTNFVNRVKNYCHRHSIDMNFVDLDQAVEERAGQKVAEIFATLGEEHFRTLEESVLREIVTKTSAETLISVGAGYKGNFPEGSEIFWLRRETDKNGRVFLDRPLLDPTQNPWLDYMQLFEQREASYQKQCHDVLTMAEGFTDTLQEYEKVFLGFTKASLISGALTLLPEFARNEEQTRKYLQRKLRQGTQFIELRDDLLNEQQMSWALNVSPQKQLLFSRRKTNGQQIPGLRTDWASELGTPPETVQIISCHGTHPVKAEEHVKFSPLIETWQQLIQWHNWWKEDRENRSFLPRSCNGRWAWYRLRHLKEMKCSFWRDGAGSAHDQPTWAEIMLSANDFNKGFAAILGEPIDHSLTPSEHYEFFNKMKLNILKIPIHENELSSEVVDFLVALGLRAAAVTSPLKKAFFPLCQRTADRVGEFSAVNTLFVHQKTGLQGDNTDKVGFAKLVELISSTEKVAVWGGGGTHKVIKSQLPQAQFFSAREGAKGGESPELLVWAVGRQYINHCKWPPEDWVPDQVIDLNYSEDSPGREYALRVGARYTSGLTMFKAQAAAQRKFWLANF